MGQLATDIHNAAIDRIPAAPAANPADLLTGPELLQIFALVETAVAALELRAAGSRIQRGAGAPAAALGTDLDLYVNTSNGDLWGKDAGAWSLIINLRGPAGTNATGTTGLSAYQLALQQGFVGSLTQWLDSLGRPGDNGLSAYQLALEQGFVGSVTQWLTSLRGEPGQDGNDAELVANSVTNEILGSDVKIGSVSAAGNAYPAADRPLLTTIEKYLVYVGGKLADIYARLSEVDSLASMVNGFNARINLLEARPVGGTGTGSGTASYPPQSSATIGKFLQASATGIAGGESWVTVANNRVGWVLTFKNEVSRNQRFFKSTAISTIRKDAGISTLSYSINGATPVSITFTAGVFSPAAGTLTFPVDSLISWAITYNSGFTEGAFEVEGTETL